MCVSLFYDTDVCKMVVWGMCVAEAASVFPTGASINLKYPVTKMQKCALVLVSVQMVGFGWCLRMLFLVHVGKTPTRPCTEGRRTFPQPLYFACLFPVLF